MAKPDFHQVKKSLDLGEIDQLEALFRWTVYAITQRTLDLKPFFTYVAETIPQVTWHKPGEKTEVRGYIPETWQSAAEFFAWADKFMGNVFSLGSWLQKYVVAADSKKPGVVAKAEERYRRNVEIHQVKAENPSLSQQVIAERFGMKRETVRNVLAEKPVMTEKTAKPPRQVTVYQINSGTDPAVAAEKIRAKFGKDFSAALAAALTREIN